MPIPEDKNDNHIQLYFVYTQFIPSSRNVYLFYLMRKIQWTCYFRIHEKETRREDCFNLILLSRKMKIIQIEMNRIQRIEYNFKKNWHFICTTNCTRPFDTIQQNILKK